MTDTIRYPLSSTIDLTCVVYDQWLIKSEAWRTYQSEVQGSVPHLLQPLTAVTMPEGGIVDRNQRHLWTRQNHIQFCSQLAHKTCRDLQRLPPAYTTEEHMVEWSSEHCTFALHNKYPSLIPRPKQPQCGSLSVPCAGKEGLSACIANRWLRLIQSIEKWWDCCCYGGHWKAAGLQIQPKQMNSTKLW